MPTLRPRGARWRPVVAALAALFSTSRCSDSTAPAKSVANFIASVTSSDTAVKAVLVTGAAPTAGSGPAATLSGTANFVTGGASQLTVASDSAFGTIIVAIDSQPNYYRLTLPSATDTAVVIITLQTHPPDTAFTLLAGVSASGAVGTYGSYDAEAATVFNVGTGDVQVSLSWDVNSDVDLHLVQPPPDSEEIYYGNPVSASGGELDLDSNAGCAIDGKRNENITWPSKTPPHGTYIVRVDYWDACTQTQTNYVVTVRVKGRAPQTFTGSFTGTGDAGAQSAGTQITTFIY
ncbi:MAG TPA: hypothetical protein VFK78_00775 [Gemmatimonadales bacterium]|nr:hypothetical protein [Gemmatimonadales bacterium]